MVAQKKNKSPTKYQIMAPKLADSRAYLLDGPARAV
jgi:hypothetical protein